MTVGIIHNRSTVLPACYTGTRTVDGGKFQIGSNPSTKLPIIRSKDTGRVWIPSWDALVHLAIAEGILSSDEGGDDIEGGVE